MGNECVMLVKRATYLPERGFLAFPEIVLNIAFRYSRYNNSNGLFRDINLDHQI